MKVQNHRLIPESDLDKMILRKMIEDACDCSGEWVSACGTRKMRWSQKRTNDNILVTDDGCVGGWINANPMKFDVEHIISGGDIEPVQFSVEQQGNDLHVIYRNDADEGCVWAMNHPQRLYKDA